MSHHGLAVDPRGAVAGPDPPSRPSALPPLGGVAELGLDLGLPLVLPGRGLLVHHRLGRVRNVEGFLGEGERVRWSKGMSTFALILPWV